MKKILKILCISFLFLTLSGCLNSNSLNDQKITFNGKEIVDEDSKQHILDIVNISNRHTVKSALLPEFDPHQIITVDTEQYYIYYTKILQGDNKQFEITDEEYDLIKNAK